jgi:hypothetical protein
LALLQGLCTIYEQLTYNLEQADLGFHQLSSATLFYVPPAPVRAPEGTAPACDTHYTAQDEAEMDQQLQQLRQQISQVKLCKEACESNQTCQAAL